MDILNQKYIEGCATLGDLQLQRKELDERIAIVEADLRVLRKLVPLFAKPTPARAAEPQE